MLILIIILSIYFITIGALIYGFTKIKKHDAIGLEPKTEFTIIVPFRDETDNLPLLLASLSKLNYPTNLFKVILVDDDSKEKFLVPTFTFQVSVLNNIRNSKSPKKDAIVTAMNTVTTDWIITTDADCVVDKNWLLILDNYIQTHKVTMIAGAVTYDCQNTFLHQFQQLDIASLQGATIGSFGINKGFMCNGANLAYTKSFFQKLNGFEGNDKIASGDDVFLLQKAIVAFPKQVHYLKSKNNIVVTKPLDDWRSLFYQRVRWASKTSSYQSVFGKTLGIIVFTGNLACIWTLGYGLLHFSSSLLFLNLLAFKIIVDAILILQSNHFLNSKKTSYLLLSSLFYPFFSVSVALYSLFGKYEWKGRPFSK
ncbi:glycosyltransferase [Flavobacterium sp. WC2430]|uniref:glycosyltransferase n=1 Tax=Flavobacterium sp. WC2430 TaxID=3234137 RepID=UPI0034674578